MVRVESHSLSGQDIPLKHAESTVLLKARDVTKELLNALLLLRSLKLRDQHDCARIKRVAAFARLRDTVAAETALVLKILGVRRRHTI